MKWSLPPTIISESSRTILPFHWTLYGLILIKLLFSNSVLSNVMDKNVWSCTFTLSDLMAWCWIKHRKDFILRKSRTGVGGECSAHERNEKCT